MLKTSINSRQEYKTIRIYPDDLKKLKRLAFIQDTTMVKLVSKAVNLLVGNHNEKELKSDENINNPKYKTVRIYPDDLKELKRLAFIQDTTMVKLVSKAINLLEIKIKKEASI